MNRRSRLRIVIAAVGLSSLSLSSLVNGRSDRLPWTAALPRARTDRAEPPATPVTRAASRVNPDLFFEPAPPATPAPEPAPLKPAKATPPVSAQPAPPPDPLAGYAYTGFVTLDGQPAALVENMKTGEGRYVHVGEEFAGGSVAGIDRAALRVKLGGGERTLTLNTDYSLVPLDTRFRRGKGGDVAAVEPEHQEAVNGLVKTYVNSFDFDTLTVLRGGITDAEAKQLHDEISAGRITQEEAERRGLRPSVSDVYNLSINNSLRFTESDAKLGVLTLTRP